MTELEKYIINQLTQLVPNADAFEVRANIGDKSYSIEFFASLDGVKYQCYEMIDNGIFKEKDFDTIVKQIAEYIRNCPEYHPGEINKFSFVTNSNQLPCRQQRK